MLLLIACAAPDENDAPSGSAESLPFGLQDCAFSYVTTDAAGALTDSCSGNYDDEGRLHLIDCEAPNGETLGWENTYDDAGCLRDTRLYQSFDDGGGFVSVFRYTCDAWQDMVTKNVSLVPTGAESSDAWEWAFTNTHEDDRITARSGVETLHGGTSEETFGYDADGWLVDYVVDSEETTYENDAAGNPVHALSADDEEWHTYDALERETDDTYALTDGTYSDEYASTYVADTLRIATGTETSDGVTTTDTYTWTCPSR
jgi:hypothetical protein